MSPYTFVREALEVSTKSTFLLFLLTAHWNWLIRLFLMISHILGTRYWEIKQNLNRMTRKGSVKDWACKHAITEPMGYVQNSSTMQWDTDRFWGSHRHCLRCVLSDELTIPPWMTANGMVTQTALVKLSLLQKQNKTKPERREWGKGSCWEEGGNRDGKERRVMPTVIRMYYIYS